MPHPDPACAVGSPGAAAEAPPVECRAVEGPEELALHLEIRHRVFVEEQRFFVGSDRDGHDDDPATVHVLCFCAGVAGGAVRLYPLAEPGVWKGDRLAVVPSLRSSGLGGPLVRFAVASAANAGGHRMLAHVQVTNVGFFEHLGWHRLGEPVEYVGRPHQLMAIGLLPVPG